MNRLFAFVIIVAAALPSFAQLPPELPPLSPLLVPMSVWNLPGRFGSVWKSELVVMNPTGHRVVLSDGAPWCSVTGCSDEFLGVDPGVTSFRGESKNPAHAGLIWYVEQAHEEELGFFLRLWDSSRGGEDWGASVPVVHQEQFLSGPTDLAGAPTDSGFRVTLRVYEPQPTNASSVLVTVLPITPGATSLDHPSVVLPLREGGPPGSDFPRNPAYAEITDVVAAFPQLLAGERFGVRIEPLTEGMRYWAMLSITHNETQHVTLITPD